VGVESASGCPKCGYVRKEADRAPGWQCPSCGIAIEKYLSQQRADEEVVKKAIGAAAASSAAMAVAAAHPATVALVQEEHWIETPPRLSLERRLGMALFDLMMAGVFLWCWISPGAWRPTLASDLGLLMLMEFFVIHSSMFLVGGSSEGGTGTKITLAFVVMLFYVPVAGAFAWWHGGWWPALAFAWLLASRVATMLAGQGSDAYASRRARYYWACGGGYYIAFVFVALVLPMPKLGFNWKAQYEWASFWSIPPQDVMAWGFLYFAAQGLAKLLENPRRIVDSE
jgi:hypothetical protein